VVGQLYISFYYFLPKTLLIIRTTIAIIATTIKIPTPTPALNIPSITEQLVNEINTIKSINNRVIFFCMGFYFYDLYCYKGTNSME